MTQQKLPHCVHVIIGNWTRGMSTLAACGVLCSCARLGVLSGPRGPALTASDFVQAPTASTHQGTPPRDARVLRVAPADIEGPVAAGKGLGDAVVAVPGPPTLPPRSTSPPVIAAGVLVDAKVGDVNGKPLYASTLLEPLGARLAAEAQRLQLPQWRQVSAKEIQRALEDFVGDELLRAEAISNLTTEQKQGFFAYMDSLQRDLQRKSGGTRSGTEQALAASDGISLDEWRQRRTDEELIKYQLEQRITRRVNVVARDLEQRYEQDYDEFHQPPVAVFRLVQVRKDKAADAALVREKLAEGGTLADIAGLPINMNNRAKQGLEEREIKGSQAETDFFPNEALNTAARSLTQGQIVGPIELSTSLAWLGLEDLRERDVSYYDAQLELDAVIRQERIIRERRKYLHLLGSRASMTSFDEMGNRLLAIAQAWYFDPVRPAARE